MRYAFNVIYHAAILVVKLGGIALSILIPLLLSMKNNPAIDDVEEADMPEKPNPADFNHPNWSYYYGPK